MTGALFPGQGSEREGMLSLVNKRWGQVLQFDIITGKIPEEFNQIYNVKLQDLTPLGIQMGIYAVSASLWEDTKKYYDYRLVAGHSLGFYSALYASNSIDFLTGLYLIKAAHMAIKDATGKGNFGMTAIIGLKWDIIENLCGEFRDIYVANINSATQVVVSGTIESLEGFEKKVNDEGALKVMRLPIQYPLHTPALKGVPDIFKDKMSAIKLQDPQIPVVDHTTGEILTSHGDIRKTLTEQFTRRVIWRDVIKKMWLYGIRRFVEVGPGDVLTKLTRWIERDAEAISLDGGIT